MTVAHYRAVVLPADVPCKAVWPFLKAAAELF